MMEFRRWLKRHGGCVVAGTLLLTGVTGCQTDSGSVRGYAPDAPAAAPPPLVVPQAVDGVTASVDSEVSGLPDALPTEPTRRSEVPPPPPEPVPNDEPTVASNSSTADDDVPVEDEPTASTLPAVESEPPVAKVASKPVEIESTLTSDVGTFPTQPTVPQTLPEVETASPSGTKSPDGTGDATDPTTTRIEPSPAVVPQIDLPEPAPVAITNEPAAVPPLDLSAESGTASPESAIPEPTGPVPAGPVPTPEPIEEPFPEPVISAPEVESDPVVEEDQFVSVEKSNLTSTIVSDDEDTLLAPGIRLISDQRLPVFHVAADAEGNVYLSQRDAILRLQPDGRSRIWAKLRAPRGHVVLRDGSHVVCVAGSRSVLKLNASGETVEELATGSNGSFLRSPSHVVADEHGGVYFTDPGYARIRNPIGNLHYISADGTVSVVARSLAFPEGVTLSSNGSRVLLVESQLNRIVEFQVLAPGKLGPKRVLARLPKKTSRDSDGFAHSLVTDDEGRLFVAHGGTQHVEVIERDGTVSQRHHIPGVIANSITFVRGKEKARLFVVGADERSRRGRVLEISLD